jgi:hypothetical protein
VPIKRIKLREIKEHPWFKQDLPSYLENILRRKGKLYRQASVIHGNKWVDEDDIDYSIVEKLFEVF